jgi:hypothetical protein
MLNPTNRQVALKNWKFDAESNTQIGGSGSLLMTSTRGEEVSVQMQGFQTRPRSDLGVRSKELSTNEKGDTNRILLTRFLRHYVSAQGITSW